ncbi:hypothetical protein Nepgr_018439 [Nepenthes gracilis]|uniref:Uncharacterized protein n=1 Tax=Nepenthes gracilis TaxID=150966 RepID=A0AAD3SS96_NEPGR|nr:hypothetical protein Nepgr_018439 [Nepenthes gracilis]
MGMVDKDPRAVVAILTRLKRELKRMVKVIDDEDDFSLSLTNYAEEVLLMLRGEGNGSGVEDRSFLPEVEEGIDFEENSLWNLVANQAVTAIKRRLSSLCGF